MSRVKRLRWERGNTWRCPVCGVQAVSEGCIPTGWWEVAQRGGLAARHFDALGCLLRWLTALEANCTAIAAEVRA